MVDDATREDARPNDATPDQRTSDDAGAVSSDAGVDTQDSSSADVGAHRSDLAAEPMELVGGCSLVGGVSLKQLPIGLLLLLMLGWWVRRG